MLSGGFVKKCFPGFQKTVLQMLVKMRGEIKELKQQQNHNTALLQSMQQDNIDDYDLVLPNGIQLPISTDEEMEAMEVALDDNDFRRRLVSYCYILLVILRFLMLITVCNSCRSCLIIDIFVHGVLKQA